MATLVSPLQSFLFLSGGLSLSRRIGVEIRWSFFFFFRVLHTSQMPISDMLCASHSAGPGLTAAREEKKKEKKDITALYRLLGSRAIWDLPY